MNTNNNSIRIVVGLPETNVSIKVTITVEHTKRYNNIPSISAKHFESTRQQSGFGASSIFSMKFSLNSYEFSIISIFVGLREISNEKAKAVSNIKPKLFVIISA